MILAAALCLLLGRSLAWWTRLAEAPVTGPESGRAVTWRV